MNFQKSKLARQDDKYQLFLRWFEQNGGKYSKEEIIFPAIFEPGSYVGIAASNQIKQHKVIMAVPQNIIITLSKVRNCELSAIISKQDIFSDEQDDDMEFNILAIYIIFQRMKRKQSFYYPYFNCLDPPQTILTWKKEQILSTGDPNIFEYVNELKVQYLPLYEKFLKVTLTNKKLFPQKLTFQFFLESYAIVMTRCFGWGLPETMIIPFADFFNHYSDGVYHYMCNLRFQNGQAKATKDYITKNVCLDLTLLGVPSKQFKKYQPNDRIKFIKGHFPQKSQQQVIQNEQYLLTEIHKREILNKPFKTPLLMSEDQQDNDTDQEQNLLSQPHYIDLMKVQKQSLEKKKINKEKRFEKPKLPINKEFEEDNEWSWWKYSDKSTYFIVSTSQFTKQYEQIYNSYGKRSNRFLLIWYGFTLEQNKYNSVPFRLWMWKGQNLKTKQIVLNRYIRDDEWENGIIIDNELFPTDMLTKEFRLKESSLNAELIVYLRLHLINNNQKYFDSYKTGSSTIKIHFPGELQFELEVFHLYLQIVNKNIKDYEADSIQSDYLRLKEDLNSTELFGLRLKISNKRILLIQRSIVGIVIQILKDLVKGIGFEEAYKTTRLEYQNDKLFRNPIGAVFYRKKIVQYLRSLNEIL